MASPCLYGACHHSCLSCVAILLCAVNTYVTVDWATSGILGLGSLSLFWLLGILGPQYGILFLQSGMLQHFGPGLWVALSEKPCGQFSMLQFWAMFWHTP